MARMTHETAREYDASGSFDIFNLENDKDAKKVQFMINSIDDIIVYTYHGVAMTSSRGTAYERKVGCLKQSKNDPEGVCPFCDAGTKIQVARFIPLYSVSEKKPLLWERSARFIDNKIAGFVNRMIGNGRALPSLVVEVVREGKKGDNQTTYAFYPMETIQAENISEIDIPDPAGSLVAEWTPQEMQQYLRDGTIPTTNNATAVNAGVQRRESRVAPPEGGAPDVTQGTRTDTPEDYF